MNSNPRQPTRRLNSVGNITSTIKNGYVSLTVNVERSLSSVIGVRIFQLNGKLKECSYTADFRPLANFYKDVYNPEVVPKDFSAIIVTRCRIKLKREKWTQPISKYRPDESFRDSVFNFQLITPGESGSKIRFKVDIVTLNDPSVPLPWSLDRQTNDILKQRVASLEEQLRFARIVAGLNVINGKTLPPPPLSEPVSIGCQTVEVKPVSVLKVSSKEFKPFVPKGKPSTSLPPPKIGGVGTPSFVPKQYNSFKKLSLAETAPRQSSNRQSNQYY